MDSDKLYLAVMVLVAMLGTGASYDFSPDEEQDLLLQEVRQNNIL